MITWKLEVALSLWAAGVAGGACLSAFLIDRITSGRHEILPKISMFLDGLRACEDNMLPLQSLFGGPVFGPFWDYRVVVADGAQQRAKGRRRWYTDGHVVKRTGGQQGSWCAVAERMHHHLHAVWVLSGQ